MGRWLRYLGPDSPWGPAIAGLALAPVSCAVMLIVAPVLLWAGKPIVWGLRAWWDFWLT